MPENLSAAEPKITVIFLLYSEAAYVPGLFESLRRQIGRFEVLFVDNGSRDHTLRVIQEEIKKAGSPSHYQIIHHPENMGISRALNHAFGRAKTPYILTVHCDVLFGRDDYVESMIDLFEKHPKAGAIAGQPAIPKKDRIPFAEKVNLVANLMDIFPPGGAGSLVPVGFVEGRCDAFRATALKAAGMYDTTLRLAGEDQVMAARMRDAGFELYQAPHLSYYLSVSSDQDSLVKLVRHQRLFGRAHPYIVLMNRKAAAGIVGESAGQNRQARTILRATQLFSALIYLLLAVTPFFGIRPVAWAGLLVLVLAIKICVFNRHSRAVGLGFVESLKFYALQPALDLSYSLGVFQGLWLLRGRASAKTIS